MRSAGLRGSGMRGGSLRGSDLHGAAFLQLCAQEIADVAEARLWLVRRACGLRGAFLVSAGSRKITEAPLLFHARDARGAEAQLALRVRVDHHHVELLADWEEPAMIRAG